MRTLKTTIPKKPRPEKSKATRSVVGIVIRYSGTPAGQKNFGAVTIAPTPSACIEATDDFGPQPVTYFDRTSKPMYANEVRNLEYDMIVESYC